MKGRRQYDLAILGGGCAGLSLAVSLVERGLGGRRLAIFEPRTGYRRDRTWCYWDVAEHAFSDAVAHRWERWAVRHGGRRIVREAQRHVYCEVPADAFYASALSRLANRPDVDLRLGTRVLGIEETARNVRVHTLAGSFRVGRVFDGRPPARPPPGTLLQHFLGVHVRTSEPAFESDTVTLMDFDVASSPKGIDFAYVLPYSDREALVEATCFSTTPFTDDRYRATIDRYLETRLGVSKFETLWQERGVIPMQAVRPPRPTARVVPIGTAGGMVRPSTGYAFLAIQRWSRMAARGILGATPLPAPRDRVSRVLDAIFLGFLRRHPERAPAVFAQLFERVEPDVLSRFLMDVGSARDRLAVVRAMPTGPFLAEALRAPGAWWRA